MEKKRIKFKQKEYTIQEGHFTGAKDIEKVPGLLSTVTKTTLAGAGIGGVTGKLLEEYTVGDGVKIGGKAGFLTGILAKLILNTLHNPMSTVKYQEVDKELRKKFGISSFSGFTFGDSYNKRKNMKEKFAFNDRDVNLYKLNFSIQNNQITMYTFDMSDEELKSVSETLDYYCKKYFGMNYTSKAINAKDNSYSVLITFTNYQVIVNFLSDLSKDIGKINILDNDSFVNSKISNEAKEAIPISSPEIRIFSKLGNVIFDKYDLFKILFSSSESFLNKYSPELKNTPNFILELIKKSIEKVGGINDTKNLNNTVLKDTLKKLRYIEGVHYTIGKNESPANILVEDNQVIITTNTNSEYDKILGKLEKFNKSIVNKKVSVYSKKMNSLSELEYFMKKILNSKIKLNIYV